MTVAINQGDDGKLSITGTGDPIELWLASRAFFLGRRPAQIGRLGKQYPTTTNGDVRQLAEVWRRVFRKLWRGDLEALDDKKAIWERNQLAIDRLLFAADDAEPFPENERFWFEWTRKPSTWLAVMRGQPSRWDIVVDALKHTVTTLPEAFADRAGDAASVAAAVGTRAGEIVAAPVRGVARGLFGSLATPLLIGAIIVGGVIIIPRVWPKARPEGAS